jgi:hypothetical protein
VSYSYGCTAGICAVGLLVAVRALGGLSRLILHTNLLAAATQRNATRRRQGDWRAGSSEFSVYITAAVRTQIVTTYTQNEPLSTLTADACARCLIYLLLCWFEANRPRGGLTFSLTNAFVVGCFNCLCPWLT